MTRRAFLTQFAAYRCGLVRRALLQDDTTQPIARAFLARSYPDALRLWRLFHQHIAPLSAEALKAVFQGEPTPCPHCNQT